MVGLRCLDTKNRGLGLRVKSQHFGKDAIETGIRILSKRMQIFLDLAL